LKRQRRLRKSTVKNPPLFVTHTCRGGRGVYRDSIY
jgi:hypothetical protein